MRNLWISLKFMLFMSIILGIVYPLIVTGVSEVFSDQAHGSLVTDRAGKTVGSKWIAQKFEQPSYFWPRPSAIDYKAELSGASNLGPISDSLRTQIQDRWAKGSRADMLYSSGSGLDPHISPEAAMAQVARISGARAVSSDDLVKMIDEHTEGRQFGVLGEPRVNVLLLNMALDER